MGGATTRVPRRGIRAHTLGHRFAIEAFACPECEFVPRKPLRHPPKGSQRYTAKGQDYTSGPTLSKPKECAPVRGAFLSEGNPSRFQAIEHLCVIQPGEWDQRQADAVGNQSHPRQRPLDGNGIGLDEHRFMKRL
jgi:hypothetical protein